MGKWYPGKYLWEDVVKPLSGKTAGEEAKRSRKLSERKYDEAQQTWDNLGDAPSWYEQAGRSPFRSEWQDINADPDKYYGSTTADEWRPDSEFVDAQKMALEDLYRTGGKFEDIYEAGGLDDITRAENEMMRQRYQTDEKAQRDAVLQRMYERGLGGSGAELAGQLSGQQSSANAQYLASLQNLAAGQARAQNALGQAGQMYGQYGQQAAQGRGQSFNESEARGRQKDLMNMYNTEFNRGVNQRQQQRMSDQDRYYNQLQQQQWQNNYNVAAGRTGQANAAANTQSNLAAQYGQQQQQALGNTVSATGQLISLLGKKDDD